MKKGKRNDYLLGGVTLFIGIYMILRTVLDIFKETPDSMTNNSPVIIVWVISVIAGIVFITAGILSVRRGRKKH